MILVKKKKTHELFFGIAEEGTNGCMDEQRNSKGTSKEKEETEQVEKEMKEEKEE